MVSRLITIKPDRPLTSTRARIINFLGWLTLLTIVSFAGWWLGLRAGAVFSAVSLVILTYLIVRKNILEIRLEAEKKSLLVRHLPWLGEPKETSYPINIQTEVSLIPATVKVPFQGIRETGRHNLVIKIRRWYKLEFYSSDFTYAELLRLEQAINELKEVP